MTATWNPITATAYSIEPNDARFLIEATWDDADDVAWTGIANDALVGQRFVYSEALELPDNATSNQRNTALQGILRRAEAARDAHLAVEKRRRRIVVSAIALFTVQSRLPVV